MVVGSVVSLAEDEDTVVGHPWSAQRGDVVLWLWVGSKDVKLSELGSLLRSLLSKSLTECVHHVSRGMG